jgi:SEC-C motif domain protein
MSNKTIKSCPCGLANSYEECCALAHQSLYNSKTAEQLMRSRYTAFTMADGNYLMKSHHSSTRPLSEKKSIVKWAKSVEWLGLEIINKSNGLEDDTEGTVEFKAHYKDKHGEQFIHENSKFVKEKGVWVYLGIV